VQSRTSLSEVQALALYLEQWEKFLDSDSLSRQERGAVNLAAMRSKSCIDRLLKLTADGKTADDVVTVDFARWGQLLKPYSVFDATFGLSAQAALGNRANSIASRTESVDRFGGVDCFDGFDRFDRWTNRVHAPTSIARWLNAAHWPVWVVTAIPFILCIGYLGICLKYRTWLQQRPWWDLLLLGLGWLAWTGSLWIGLAFCLFAAVVVCDTYWLISVRSRQNALRGPR
jgi:hypothetical protein